jgi:hypothetical protein
MIVTILEAGILLSLYFNAKITTTGAQILVVSIFNWNGTHKNSLLEFRISVVRLTAATEYSQAVHDTAVIVALYNII